MEANENLTQEGREYAEEATRLIRDFEVEWEKAEAAARARKEAGIKKKKGDTRPDTVAQGVLKHRKLASVVPELNAMGGGVDAAFPVNYIFRYRSTPWLVGLHSDLQCGVGTMELPGGGPKVATSIISGSGYINRDLGGLLETYMGVDTAVLACPGQNTDQDWDQDLIAPLVVAHETDSPLRLLRQFAQGGRGKPIFYQQCGLYRIVDRWRACVAFDDSGEQIEAAAAEAGEEIEAAAAEAGEEIEAAAAEAGEEIEAADDEIESEEESARRPRAKRSGKGAAKKKGKNRKKRSDDYIHCFIKLERLPGQEPLVPVELPSKTANRTKEARSMAARRDDQHAGSVAVLKDLDTKTWPPELCGNCYMDGDGRKDIYPCHGCEDRLAMATALRELGSPEAPGLPEPCRRHRCSERMVLGGDGKMHAKRCVHTAEALICSECIDLDDLPTAKSDETVWTCAMCANWNGAWGNQQRRNERGRFLLKVEMEAAMARRCEHPELAMALPLALQRKEKMQLAVAAAWEAQRVKDAQDAADEEKKRKEEEEKAAAKAQRRTTRCKRKAKNDEPEGDEAGPSGAAPVTRQRRRVINDAQEGDEAGPSGVAPAHRRRRAAGGREGPAEDAAPTVQRQHSEQPAMAEMCGHEASLVRTEVNEYADDCCEEFVSPSPVVETPAAAVASPGRAVAGTPAPVESKREACAAAVPAAPGPSLAAILPLLQSFPEVREKQGLIGRYASKYQKMSPAERHDEHSNITLMAQISGVELMAYLEGIVR